MNRRALSTCTNISMRSLGTLQLSAVSFAVFLQMTVYLAVDSSLSMRLPVDENNEVSRRMIACQLVLQTIKKVQALDMDRKIRLVCLVDCGFLPYFYSFGFVLIFFSFNLFKLLMFCKD